MNLRDQLKQILPEILPRNPADAIKGTELIQLVKFRLNQTYSDATLRYHFSIMSCDPSSPIAKVEQGQGYYFRTTTLHSLESARNLISPSQGLFGESLSSEEVDIAIARANKFRAIFKRFQELESRFPYPFERSFSQGQPAENHWRFPDAALVQWLVDEAGEEGIKLDSENVAIRRKMGGAPFRISACKLKLDVHHATIREDIFKTLSAALWANRGELVVASGIADEQLIDDIRRLASQFGVGVISFGLEEDAIDDMPEAAAIANLAPREFEALQGLFDIRRIAISHDRGGLEWDMVNQYRAENEEFARMYDWLAKCLADEKPYTVEEFQEQGS